MYVATSVSSARTPTDLPRQPQLDDLIAQPGEERRVDRHQPEGAAERERVQHGGFAQAQDRDVDGGARFEQPRLLEMPEHERRAAAALRLDGVAYRLAAQRISVSGLR